MTNITRCRLLSWIFTAAIATLGAGCGGWQDISETINPDWTGVRVLEIDIPIGDVNITRGDGSINVEMSARSGPTLDRMELDTSLRLHTDPGLGAINSLTITGIPIHDMEDDYSYHLDIAVPADVNLNDLKVTILNGDLELGDLNPDNAEISITNGDATVRNNAPTLASFEIATGDMDWNNGGEMLHPYGRVTNGNIRLDRVNLENGGSLSTENGNVHATIVGDARVVAEVTSGGASFPSDMQATSDATMTGGVWTAGPPELPATTIRITTGSVRITRAAGNN